MGTEYPAATGPTVLRAAGDRLGAGTDAPLTVVGELQAVRYGRRPGHLSDHDGPIHDRG